MTQTPLVYPGTGAKRRLSAAVASIAGRTDWRALRIGDLPKPLLCVPLVMHFLWLGVRYRSLTLPSSVNPRIETGGLAGESKSACLAQIGAAHQSHVADWRLVRPGEDADACREAAGLEFPLIAKPDIGWCGYGVRRIDDAGALLAYQAAFPAQGAFMLQRFVAGPHEAGLSYVRLPGARAGRLVAMTLRHAPRIVGDGVRSVAEMIAADPNLRRHARHCAASLGEAALALVPRRGAVVMPTSIASLRIGARYEDASASISVALAQRVDAIAGTMPDFHVGRFDVRFDSMDALLGGAFSIIEVNGAGAEAIQFWDPGFSLRAAFAGVFANQLMLFALGARMREAGHAPVGVAGLARAWLHQRRLIRRYPA